MMDKMELIPNIVEDAIVKLTFPTVEPLARAAIEVSDVAFSYAPPPAAEVVEPESAGGG